jgi:hypothetical protein
MTHAHESIAATAAGLFGGMMAGFEHVGPWMEKALSAAVVGLITGLSVKLGSYLMGRFLPKSPPSE